MHLPPGWVGAVVAFAGIVTFLELRWRSMLKREDMRERDKQFLKCLNQGMSDEELGRKFNLKIEGVKAFKERLRGLENKQSH